MTMVTMGRFEVQKCRWHEGGKYLCLFAGRRKSRVYPQSNLVTHGGTVDIWHAYGGHNCTLPAARLILNTCINHCVSYWTITKGITWLQPLQWCCSHSERHWPHVGRACKISDKRNWGQPETVLSDSYCSYIELRRVTMSCESWQTAVLCFGKSHDVGNRYTLKVCIDSGCRDYFHKRTTAFVFSKYVLASIW